jgi:hypothetical protein
MAARSLRSRPAAHAARVRRRHAGRRPDTGRHDRVLGQRLLEPAPVLDADGPHSDHRLGAGHHRLLPPHSRSHRETGGHTRTGHRSRVAGVTGRQLDQLGIRSGHRCDVRAPAGTQRRRCRLQAADRQRLQRFRHMARRPVRLGAPDHRDGQALPRRQDGRDRHRYDPLLHLQPGDRTGAVHHGTHPQPADDAATRTTR